MKETILIFHLPDKEQCKKVSSALLPLRLRLKLVEQKDYNQPLGALAGIHEIPRAQGIYTGEDLPDTLFVFAFLSERHLDQALNALRHCGAGPFPYKAVLTPVNQFWTAPVCFDQICREHEEMHRRPQTSDIPDRQ